MVECVLSRMNVMWWLLFWPCVVALGCGGGDRAALDRAGTAAAATVDDPDDSAVPYQAVPVPDLRTRKSGDDWPRFLGPHGNSTSGETGILTDWPASGPRIVWQRKLGTSYGIGTTSKGRFFQFDRYGDKDRSGALGGVIAHHPPDPGRHEAVAPDDHLAVLHTTQDPFARDLSHFCRNGQCEALCLGGGDDRLRDRVLGGLIERGREAQDVVLVHAIVAVDRHEEGVTFGEINIPPAVASNPDERDRVEQDFLMWRKTEMKARLKDTLDKLQNK